MHLFKPPTLLRKCLLALIAVVGLAPSSGGAAVEAPSRQRSPEAVTLGRRVFDLRIVIDAAPRGDNNTETADERTPYERVIQRFADAVYEQSNGTHFIKSVSIYTWEPFTTTGDIFWRTKTRGRPFVEGSLGEPHARIHMYNVFEKARRYSDGTAEDISLIDDPEAAAAVLANAWSQSAYGLLPEVAEVDEPFTCTFDRPCESDLPPQASILHAPLSAIGGSFAALNLSMPASYTRDSLGVAVESSAQYRRFRASAWETLARPVGKDPQPGRLGMFGKTRTEYPEMAAGAPAATDTSPLVELPDPAARQYLDIRWRAPRTTFQVMFDSSGSLSYDGKLAHARKAMRVILSMLQTEVSRVGTIRFDDFARILVSPTELDSEDVRTALMSSFENITNPIAGNAALGFQEAYHSHLAAREENEPLVMFYITDGIMDDMDAFVQLDGMLGRLYSIGAKVCTVGIGPDQVVKALRSVAEATQGHAIAPAPTSLRSLVSSVAAALDKTTRTKFVSRTSGRASSTTVVSLPATAEDYHRALMYTLAWTAPAPRAAGTGGQAGARGTSIIDTAGLGMVELVSPSGVVQSPATGLVEGEERLLVWQIPFVERGTWNLRFRPAGADVEYEAIALMQRLEDPILTDVRVWCVGGNNVVYPNPMVLVASARGPGPLAGVGLEATIEIPGTDDDPVSRTQSLRMMDDGILPDQTAGDGNYTAEFNYYRPGAHTVYVSVVPGAETRETTRGRGRVPGIDGKVEPAPPDSPVTSGFDLHTQTRVIVERFGADDHVDTSFIATFLPTDDSLIAGRFDRAAYGNTPGDLDYFVIEPPAEMETLVVRISNCSEGMRPRLRLYDSSRFSLIAEATLTNSSSEYSNVYVAIPKPGRRIYAQVSNELGSAPQSYSISAGAPRPFEFVPASIAFDFLGRDTDWSLVSVPPFDSPEGSLRPANPGSLVLKSTTNSACFGYFESPVLSPYDAMLDGSTKRATLLRARYSIRSTVADPSRVPEFRLRSNMTDYRRGDYVDILSRSDGGGVPGPGGRQYTLYFEPPAGSHSFTVSFDLLNFDATDAPDGELLLDRVVIIRDDIARLEPRTLEKFYDFNNSTEGWLAIDVSAAGFHPPAYVVGNEALILRGQGANGTFGFWASPAEVVIARNRLYIATFEIESSVAPGNRQKIPQFRLRLNDAGFHAAAYQVVESRGDAMNSPAAGERKQYRVIFRPPEVAIGQPLLLSFDLLNFDPADDPSAALSLHSVTVETVPIPDGD